MGQTPRHDYWDWYKPAAPEATPVLKAVRQSQTGRVWVQHGFVRPSRAPPQPPAMRTTDSEAELIRFSSPLDLHVI